jgi:hypothetical protein
VEVNYEKPFLKGKKLKRTMARLMKTSKNERGGFLSLKKFNHVCQLARDLTSPPFFLFDFLKNKKCLP